MDGCWVTRRALSSNTGLNLKFRAGVMSLLDIVVPVSLPSWFLSHLLHVFSPLIFLLPSGLCKYLIRVVL